MSKQQNNAKGNQIQDGSTSKNSKKDIFPFIGKNVLTILNGVLGAVLGLSAEIKRKQTEARNKKKLQIFIKRKIFGSRKVDKNTLLIALALVEERKELLTTIDIKEIMQDADFVKKVRETTHQTQINTDREYRTKHLTDLAQDKFTAKKKYLKQAARKARKDFLNDERISYDTAIAILNTPAEIDLLIGDAQEEITHNRSGIMRNMWIGLLAGVSLLILQKIYESAFPPGGSKLVKDISIGITAIQEEQKKTTEEQKKASEEQKKTAEEQKKALEELKKIISRENARHEVAALRQEIGKTNSNMMVQEELVKENEALRNENARLKNGQGVEKPPLALLKEGKTVTVPFKETIVPLKLKSKPPSAQHAQPSHPTL